MKKTSIASKLYSFAKKIANYPERGAVTFIRLFFSSLGLILAIVVGVLWFIEAVFNLFGTIIKKIKVILAMVGYILVENLDILQDS